MMLLLDRHFCQTHFSQLLSKVIYFKRIGQSLFQIQSLISILILSKLTKTQYRNFKTPFLMHSTPSYIKCFQCRQSPKQFTFLLCNHIICGRCISKNIQTTEKYSLVKCSCGSATYFNDENQIIQSGQVQIARLKRQVKISNNKVSLGQRNSVKSRQTMDQNSKNLLNERSTMPMLQVSQVFSLDRSEHEQIGNYRQISLNKKRLLNESITKDTRNIRGTQNTNYDESLLLQSELNRYSMRKPQVRAINEFSTHYISEKPKPYAEYQQSMLKNIKTVKQSIVVRNQPKKEIQTQVNIHSQFQSEIEFLRILFNKDVEEVEFQFRKTIKDFKKMYKKLQEQLRALYIEEVITGQELSGLNLSSLIKKKYKKGIGQKFKNFKDQLFLCLYNQKQHKCSTKNIKQSYLQTIGHSLKRKQRCSIPLSHSSIRSENDQQKMTLKNKNTSKFHIVQQKLDRLTTKQNQRGLRNDTDYDNFFDQDIGKRIKTQNIHTNIKRSKRIDQNQNQRPTRCQTNVINSQQHFRYTQKPNKTINSIINIDQESQNKRTNYMKNTDQQSQNQDLRKHIIYYSPPLPYCYKHFQKRSKQAKNYISYIEKLCHQKKMKSNQELFKKVKHPNPYDFKNRE